MDKALKVSRKEFSKHTPKMEIIKVDKKDIATVIGKGGATIREIVETSGAKVDVKDTGEVTVAAPDEESRNKAIEFIKSLVAKPEMGKIYKGKVMKDYGVWCFCKLFRQTRWSCSYFRTCSKKS